MLPKLARFCYKKRWWVLVFWIVLLVGATVWSQKVGTNFSTDLKLPGSDSQATLDLLKEHFPSRSGATGDLVFKANKNVTDPSVQQAVSDVVAKLKQVPAVGDVITPYVPEGAGQISPEGNIARATIQFNQSFSEITASTADKIKEVVASSNTPDVQFELGGRFFANVTQPGSTEVIGLAAAVLILLIAFGSLLAMGLPIITALFGIGIGLAIVGLTSHVLSLPDFANQLATMLGIGVGIDYALFIVTRYRQGLRDKMSPENAVITAVNTAGRSVIFAGITVIVSLLGMVLMNISFIQGLGISVAMVVGVTMLASITLLPAILGFAGKNIDRFKIPGVGREPRKGEHNLWYRWAHLLERHAAPILAVGLILIMTLSIPFFSMKLGSSDASSRPTSDTTRRAYDLQTEGFGPGFNGPLVLVTRINGAQDLAVLQEVQKATMADSNVAFASPAMPNKDFSAAIMQVYPKTSPQDEGTVDLIHRLREQILPTSTANSGLSVHVGGLTATFDDVAQVLSERLPIFIGVVLALSFVLLLVVFRSVIIPIKAVTLNMLSIGAAYGVVVAVFQWGWLKDLFGVGASGPIESFLPMMLFAILFGLSMDYEIFLLSRIKEEYDRTKVNKLAVGAGLTTTARVITAAAAIMITVFGSFVLGDERVIKEFGVGLAAAILIDASIARLVLVPAAMELFGKANWWLPKWLHWLPKVHIDGNEVPTGIKK